VGAVAVAAAAVILSGAWTSVAAGRVRLPSDEPLLSQGSVIYSWQGDPARGCAADGLCAVHGAIVTDGIDYADLNRFGRAGGIVFSGQVVARVSDGPGAGECVDTIGDLAGIDLTPTAGRGFSATFQPPGPSSGRCAGPLPSDLAAVTLPVRVAGAGRRLRLDLRTHRSFVAARSPGRLTRRWSWSPLPRRAEARYRQRARARRSALPSS